MAHHDSPTVDTITYRRGEQAEEATKNPLLGKRGSSSNTKEYEPSCKRTKQDPLFGKIGSSSNTKEYEQPCMRNKQGNTFDVCKGIRVFYYEKAAGSLQCDHTSHHTEVWKKEVDNIAAVKERSCLEAGVVVTCSMTDNDKLFEVRWDCGAMKTYSNAKGELKNICILDMGPAGYRTPIVLCDICKTHLTGFSFRCTHQMCSVDECDIYDLCYKHYNDGWHLDGDYKDHQFQCIMQNTLTFERKRNIVPLRSESKTFELVGLFAGADVAKIDGDSQIGKLKKVVHKDGVGVDKAGSVPVDVWHCTAEIDYGDGKDLVYEDIGNKGKVGILALTPGDGGLIYADHFPTIEFENFYIIEEMLNFHQSTKIQLDSGDYCYISQDHSTLTICNALIDKIDSENVWSSCKNLKLVDFTHNKLNTIPDQLLLYKDSIISIGLASNCFKMISPLLFKFKELVHLNMIQNQLTIIPSNIKSFSNLRNLLLDNNNIRVLPCEISDLANLEILGLSFNLLISLPQSISKLHRLKRLELHHNHFKVYPSVLYSADLSALMILTLDNNRIQIVPDEAKHLISKRSIKFTIHSNPIQIKGAVLDPSDNSKLIGMIIANDNRSERQRGTLRVLVIGESCSGKSSLVRALVDRNNYITPVDTEKVDHTVGINNYFYRFRNNGIVYELNLWDFAGEKCYAMMNQIFISSGSLVWIVYDMSKYIDDRKHFEDNIGTWLRAVIARIGTPVVWIIGTHADKCQQADRVKANVEKFLIEAFENMKSSTNTCVLNLDLIEHSINIFSISNACDLNGHKNLHRKIEELPVQMEFSASFEQFKPNWSSAEEYLIKLIIDSQNLPILSMDKTFDCLKKENLILDKKEFETFIENLHAAGEILLFKGNIYLDIVRLIQLLREIFRNDLTDQLKILLGTVEAERAEQCIKTTGIISRDIISNYVWRSTEVDRHLQLLLDFGLAFKVTSKTYPDSLLFPWLLIDSGNTEVPFSNIASILPLKRHIIVLVHKVEYILPSFFVQFCCSVNVEIQKITRNHMSASLNHHSIFVVLMPEDKDPYKGYIVLFVGDDRQRNCSYSTMWSTLNTLTNAFQQLVEEWKGFGPLRTWVVCPKCIQSQVEHPFLFEYTPLEESTKYVTCKRCEETIRAKRVFPPQGNPAQRSILPQPQPSSSSSQRKKSLGIKQSPVGSPSDREPSTTKQTAVNTNRPKLKDLQHLEISDWGGLGLDLGLSKDMIDIIKTENKEVQFQRREMFSCWLKTSNEPSYEILIRALRMSKDNVIAKELEEKYCRNNADIV